MCFPKIIAKAPSPSGKDARHVTTGEWTPAVAAYPPPTMAGPQTRYTSSSPRAQGLASGVYRSVAARPAGMGHAQAGARATEAADPTAAAAVRAKTTFMAFPFDTNPWATGWQPYDRRNAPFASSRPTSRSCKSLMTLCERCQRHNVIVQSVDLRKFP